MSTTMIGVVCIGWALSGWFLTKRRLHHWVLAMLLAGLGAVALIGCSTADQQWFVLGMMAGADARPLAYQTSCQASGANGMDCLTLAP